jgi:hypothetical protein
MESPKFVDFWSQNIKIPQLRIEQGSYKGEAYNVVVWRKTVLYPQKTGKLVLEPLTLNVTAELPTNRRDFFGDRIMRQVNRVVTAGELRLNVKPLPEQGKPDDFTGAVGDFNFDVLLNKKMLKASESFQARIKVSGSGNLTLFKLPKLKVPNTLEVYEPEHKEDVKTSLRGMQGTIQDTYTIVPQYQGKYPISPLTFSYFNPKTKRYEKAVSQNFVVDVFEGPLATNGNAPQSTPSNVIPTTNANFKFIKLKAQWQQMNSQPLWGTKRFYLLLISPIFLLLMMIPLRRWQQSHVPDVQSQKQKAASKRARRFLARAKKNSVNKTLFYEALEAALHNYLKSKLKIETTDFNKETIETLLRDKGVDTDLSKGFVALLGNCEQARYAPSSEVQIQNDYEAAVRIITQIDRKL